MTGINRALQLNQYISLTILALFGLILLTGCAIFKADKLYKSGTQALERGDFEQCIQELENAKELLPNLSSIVRNNLGFCYEKVGRIKDAWFEFRQAVINNHQNNSAISNFLSYWERFKEQGILVVGASVDSIIENMGEPDFRRKSGTKKGEILGYGNDQMLVIWARKTLEIRDASVWKID